MEGGKRKKKGKIILDDFNDCNDPFFCYFNEKNIETEISLNDGIGNEDLDKILLDVPCFIIETKDSKKFQKKLYNDKYHNIIHSYELKAIFEDFCKKYNIYEKKEIENPYEFLDSKYPELWNFIDYQSEINNEKNENDISFNNFILKKIDNYSRLFMAVYISNMEKYFYFTCPCYHFD